MQRSGRRETGCGIVHRPGLDAMLSAPRAVSFMAMAGGDVRIVEAHDRAVNAIFAWIEKNAVETRLRDRATGAVLLVGGQKMAAATFRHDTSRNPGPQLHTHAGIAYMAQGEDSKWSTTGCSTARWRLGRSTARS